MNQFFLDKTNKVPLYLQLKDQIKYYISTGAMKSQERLPPVKALAKNLGINFLTVRKAYKELEQDGLVTIKHGDGCFISLGKTRLHQTKPAGRNASAAPNLPAQFAGEIQTMIERYVREGLEIEEARQTTEKVFAELEGSRALPIVVFAECNQFQVSQISRLLAEQLNLEVKPFLIVDLQRELPRLIEDGRTLNIVTTGFHVNEIRKAIGDLPAQVDVLITNLNPDTRRKLEAVGENGKYGFICRDQESAVLYKDLLKAELGFDRIDLTSCTLAETDKVQNILETVDMILASPPVFEAVQKLVSHAKPVFNLFERVDPMSLKVIKDKILGAVEFSNPSAVF